MENEELKTETAVNNKKSCCKGDLRTFVIALLTAIITILIYHCAVSWFCGRNNCSDLQKLYVIHQSADSACHPCRGERKFKGERCSPMGEKFRRFKKGGRDEKNTFRGKRRMSRPAPEQPAPEQPAPEQKSAE